MIFRWGHFADLHFQYPDYTNTSIRTDLNDKLKKLCSGKPLHAIFVAGDVFNKGSIMRNDGSEEADDTVIDAVVGQLRNMAETCQCEIKNLIVVPGNHDLPRTPDRQETLGRIIRNYQSVEASSNPTFRPTRTEQGAIYDVACSPFKRFCEKLYADTGREVQFPHDYFELKHEDIHWANVVTLNTATFDAFSHAEAEGKFKRNTPYFCINDAKLSDLEKRCKDGNFEHTIDFVLAHHSIEYFAPKEANALIRFMEKVGIDLYLCGHIHRQGFYTFNSRHDIRQISCGGIFNDNREGYNEPCFYIGEYDNVTQEATIYAYTYSATAKAWVEATGFPSPWEDGRFSRKLLRLPSLSLRESIKRVFLSDRSPDISSYGFPKTVRNFLHSHASNGRFVADMLDILKVDIDSTNHTFHNADTKQLDFVVYYCLALYYKQRGKILDGKFCLKNLVEDYTDCFDEYLLFWETKAWLARRIPDYEEAYQYDMRMQNILREMGFVDTDAIKYNAGVFVSFASTITYALEDTADNACPWLKDKDHDLEMALNNMSLIAESWKKTYGTTEGYPKHYSIWIMLLVHKCLRTESLDERSDILRDIYEKIKESHKAKDPYPLD